MTRFLFLLLAAPLFLAGCGEADHSRFIPATDATSKAPAADRPSGAKVPGEFTIPKNIPMH